MNLFEFQTIMQSTVHHFTHILCCYSHRVAKLLTIEKSKNDIYIVMTEEENVPKKRRIIVEEEEEDVNLILQVVHSGFHFLV